VTECITTGWISSSGRFLTEFEEAWAGYCGRQHGVAVSNGTVALQAAVEALELGPGDEVIMPTFTIVSCATAVLSTGATPVLVDSEPRTWCLDVDQVEARIGPQTRAIMPVHIYGHPADMNRLVRLADDHGLAIIEDAAEAHGAEVETAGGWKRCGSFGDVSCFSFYANKLVTTGEGGMVLTDSAELAERLRSVRNLGFGPRRFYHEQLGHNFRLTNLQAAIGLAQVERIDEVVARKREIGRRYADELTGLPLSFPIEEPWAHGVYWMVGLLLDDDAGLDAEELAGRLRTLGVETRPFFLGMHEQPAFHERGLFVGEYYPVAEGLARRGLYVPSGVALTDDQLEEVVAAVRQVFS
jgi:perosamine synthetase